MTKKRPHASEGHLHLPRDLSQAHRRQRSPQSGPPQSGPPQSGPPQPGPPPAEAPPRDGGGAALEPLSQAPFVEDGSLEEGGMWTARVLDDALVDCEVRTGDRVVVVRARTPEFGDLVAVASGQVAAGQGDEYSRLWRAYPDAETLHLSAGERPTELPRATPVADVAVLGVVVAVLRQLRNAPREP